MKEEGESRFAAYEMASNMVGGGGRIFKLHSIKKNIKLSSLAKQDNAC